MEESIPVNWWHPGIGLGALAVLAVSGGPKLHRSWSEPLKVDTERAMD